MYILHVNRLGCTIRSIGEKMRFNMHIQKFRGQSRSSQNHSDQTCKTIEDGSWSNEEDEVFDGCLPACSF